MANEGKNYMKEGRKMKKTQELKEGKKEGGKEGTERRKEGGNGKTEGREEQKEGKKEGKEQYPTTDRLTKGCPTDSPRRKKPVSRTPRSRKY